jgi:hypothetical protein
MSRFFNTLTPSQAQNHYRHPRGSGNFLVTFEFAKVTFCVAKIAAAVAAVPPYGVSL